ncbi:hypothetical protein [Massilia sp. HP4]|uniref:DUF7661 family protein n=1 Tax=Massilia sp. HP4 TaxID=2562316 RepID=UPI0010BFF04A|nr:hypothetical protein [Massilia sp. HP4]
MKFNIYGRFQIEVQRENGAWVAYRLDPGKRGQLDELVIPSELETHDIATYLDDIYHEYAGFGQNVERIGN